MLFNSTKRRRSSETSTSLYLVNENHYYQGRELLLMTNLGLSISYDRVLEISTKMSIKFAHVTNLKKLSVRLNFIKRRYLPQQLLTILTTIPVLPQLRVPFTEHAFRTTPLT